VIVPDANLLLYAYDQESPFHDSARVWWEACMSGSEPIGLVHPTLFAFIRLATHPRVYVQPMTLHEAAGHVRSWLDRRVTQLLQPTPDHVEQVITLLAEAQSSGGNLVTDAQIAAMALSHRAVVHTADRDFLRFPRIQTVFPLDA
jgi:uncharacterized protein